MNILIVSNYISTSKTLDFYQSQQINLAKSLKKLNLNVSIISGKRNPDSKDYEVIDNVDIKFLNVFKFFPERLLNQTILLNLWKSLKSSNFDIVQTSEYQSLTTLIIAVYCLIFNKKMIIYQGVYRESDNFFVQLLSKIWDVFFGFIIVKATNVVVCKTKKSADFLTKKKFTKKVVIPVGVNVELFNFKNDSLIMKKDKVRFLMVGNLIKLKNYSQIIDSLKLLKEKAVDFNLIIIGKGVLLDDILSQIDALCLNDNIKIIDNITNNKMQYYYLNSDFTLSFSLKEIFGMTILESMSCGCPVISNFMPGPSDVIINGFNGFKISSNSCSNIANSIFKIINGPPLSRLKIAQYTSKNYSWDAIAERYNIVYKKIINNEYS
tara:strand:+ start:11567 stop:12703 length:1137 start_codon:yes stop_codon:yes gene_type:complete